MKRHYSKIDWWIIALSLVGTFCVVMYMALELFDRNYESLWMNSLFLVVLVILLLLISWPLYYDIDNEHLTIRMGIIRWHIPIHSIRAVYPSRALWKAPALSFDRLRIDYEKRGVNVCILVSPQHRHDFMNDLVNHSRHLKIDGDTVVCSTLS